MKIQSNLVKRTLTGIVFVAVIIASILISRASFFLVMAFLWGFMIFEYRKMLKENGSPDQKKSLWYSVFAYFYIILPFFFLILLHRASPLVALALFAFVWVNDTFAYLVGTKFGKTKLFERISPKKTWEGFFGGLFFTIIAGVLFCYFVADGFVAKFIIIWIGLAIVVVVFGTAGDLFESYIKRSLNVKDSGTLLPGHGGLLDRLDSILFAAPAATAYLLLASLWL
ncbi:MAG: phosphatidate cytidylyltransferase [Bacteroidales bacterium]|nr:phosphatidate cytidylyltransferase [Bacteroidales bacterium]